MAGSAQEALIAELLGDVGRLHDQIKALPQGLGPALAALDRSQSEALARIERQTAAIARLEAATRQLTAAIGGKPPLLRRCRGWFAAGLVLGGLLAHLI